MIEKLVVERAAFEAWWLQAKDSQAAQMGMFELEDDGEYQNQDTRAAFDAFAAGMRVVPQHALDVLKQLVDRADHIQDEGPEMYGWKSDELKATIAAANAILESQRPVDAEAGAAVTISLACETGSPPHPRQPLEFSTDGGVTWIAADNGRFPVPAGGGATVMVRGG